MIGRDKKSTGGQQNFRDHTLIAPSARIVGDIEFNGGLHVQGEVVPTKVCGFDPVVRPVMPCALSRALGRCIFLCM